MTRRASPSEQTGAGGVSGTKSDFIAIGWGPMENDHHDIGTDLVVWVRDARLFDLGLLVGVQVKGGKSWFGSPKKVDGQVEGWWYAEEDRSHFDAWASSSVPHLLVLHDLDAKTSYWTHITTESIISTGKGAKVLVPKANTVDKEHLPELLQVAAVNQHRPSWEGTTWNDAQSLALGDQWRYAAIVPRLVAPHPNSFPEDAITPVEAFAMLVQCRFQDLNHRLGQHPELPNLLEAESHDNWDWRFVGTFAKYLSGNPADLKVRAEEAPPDHRKCAAVVTLACAYLNGDQPEQALDVLHGLIEGDQAGPVDQAWLQIQRGRVRSELGQLTDARADAFHTLSVGDQAAEDLTATALAGSAAALIFGTSSFDQMDVKDLVTAGDTIAGWWRSQEISSGLSHSADRNFKLWTRDEGSITFAAEDLASTKLLASSIAAGFAADHGGWRRAVGLMGTDALMRVGRDADPPAVAQNIELLRISGDSKDLKLANARLLSDGPAAAVAIAAGNIDPAKSTRTTSHANLELLGQAGDVLESEVADRNVLWLRETLANPQSFGDRATPHFLLDLKIVETIAGLLPSCSEEVNATIADDICDLVGCEDQLKAKTWGRIAQQIPAEVWTKKRLEELKKNADSHDFTLRFATLGIVAKSDAGVRNRLLAEAADGSADALAVLGSVREIPQDTVGKVVANLVTQTSQIIEEANGGTHGFGYDPTHTLAMLNVWHPDEADWNALCEILEAPAVAAEHKAGAMVFLGFHPERIPSDRSKRIGEIARATTTRDVPVNSMFGQGPKLIAASAKLALLLNSFEKDEANTRLIDLLGGGSTDRRWAAHALAARNRPDETPLLVDLITDHDPHVRSAAAAFVAGRFARGESSAIESTALLKAVDDPGNWVPARIVEAWADCDELPVYLRPEISRLTEHRSSYVRSMARACEALLTAESGDSP